MMASFNTGPCNSWFGVRLGVGVSMKFIDTPPVVLSSEIWATPMAKSWDDGVCLGRSSAGGVTKYVILHRIGPHIWDPNYLLLSSDCRLVVGRNGPLWRGLGGGLWSCGGVSGCGSWRGCKYFRCGRIFDWFGRGEGCMKVMMTSPTHSHTCFSMLLLSICRDRLVYTLSVNPFSLDSLSNCILQRPFSGILIQFTSSLPLKGLSQLYTIRPYIFPWHWIKLDGWKGQ